MSMGKGIRMFGVKFFKLLNIGRLFLDGVEVTATAAQLNAAGGSALPGAEDIEIADENGRYTAEDVEAALQEIAGDGRTTETVKSAYDLADGKYSLPIDGVPASDLAAAVQASLGLADDAYQLPVTGVPAADMEEGVQESLGKADSAMQGSVDVTHIRGGKVTLNGIGPTPVVFGDSTVASHTGTESETFNFSSNDKELDINPDGEGNENIVFDGGVKGYHEGVVTGLGDISGQPDNKFQIKVDHLTEWQDVVLTLVNCDTGANTAAEMQTKIQALGGMYSAVTVVFTQEAAGPPQTGKYTITSAIYGTVSKVRIQAAATNNVTEELGIGEGVGTNSDGDGFAANYAYVTAQEVVDFLVAEAVNFTAVLVGDKVQIKGLVGGGSLVVGANTGNAILGFTADTYLGAVGLGYETDMADDAYLVCATLNGVAQVSIADNDLSVTNRSTAGFDVECETAAATVDVDLIIVGKAAAAA